LIWMACARRAVTHKTQMINANKLLAANSVIKNLLELLSPVVIRMGCTLLFLT